MRRAAVQNAGGGFPGNGQNPAAPSLGGGGMQPQGFESGNNQTANAQTPNNIEDQVMNAAKEMALIEQNRIATQDAVDAGLMPPLPPTMLTPPDARGQGGSPLIVPANNTQPSSGRR